MSLLEDYKESKILIFGDKFVGKTALVHRVISDEYNPSYNTSRTVELKKRKLKIGKKILDFKLWDVPGKTTNYEMNPLLLRGTKLGLILGDVNTEKSYKSAIKWKKEVIKACKRYGIDDFPFILVMNKADVVNTLKRLPHKFQTDVYIRKFAEKNGFKSGVKISCKSGFGVKDLLVLMSEFGSDGSTAANSFFKGSYKLSVRTLDNGIGGNQSNLSIRKKDKRERCC